MRKTAILMAFALVFPAVLASAAEKAAKDPGEILFTTKTCVACHGSMGNKAILDYPNLAGQDPVYLFNQTQDITSGKRVASVDDSGHPRTQGMREIMHLTTTEELKQITTWLGSLEPDVKPVSKRKRRSKKKKAAVAAPQVDPKLVAAGKKLFKKKQCRVCHGKEGKKPLKAHSFLAGRKAIYMALQMKDSRGKVRTNGKTKTMLPFVKKLKDKDIEAITAYLSTLDRPTLKHMKRKKK